MARSRRGGGGSFGARKAPAPRRAPAPTPAPARQASTAPAPMQQSSGGGMLSGIGSTIAQGMAFGTGSAIAHQTVGAIAGSMRGSGSEPVAEAPAQPVAAEQQQLAGPCGSDKQMFFECLQINRGDQEACSFLFQNLQECQRNQSQMSFQ